LTETNLSYASVMFKLEWMVVITKVGSCNNEPGVLWSSV